MANVLIHKTNILERGAVIYNSAELLYRPLVELTRNVIDRAVSTTNIPTNISTSDALFLLTQSPLGRAIQ